MVFTKIKLNTNNPKILTDLEPFDGNIFHSDLDQSSYIKKKKKKKKRRRKKHRNHQISLNEVNKKVNLKLYSSVNEHNPNKAKINDQQKYSPWDDSNRNRLLGNEVMNRIMG